MAIKIKVTIEPTWATDSYTEVFEVDDAELEGLTGRQRDKKIIDLSSDVVENACPWGAQELDSADEEG